MLEKIKAIPFVDESAAVKVVSAGEDIILERTDKVIWARESTTLKGEGVNCYVEAKKFFPLMEDIKELRQNNHLEVILKNGAKYELPFIDVTWDSMEMPEEYHDTITFKISDLMMTTLRNLIKPELQCIYFDEHGAVSCDLISACISTEVKSRKPFLLPLDVQDLILGKTASVNASTDTLYIKGHGFEIATMKPDITDEWFNDLREMIEGDAGFISVNALNDSLKRLELFDEYVTFDGEKAIAGSNFEPFAFKDLNGHTYEIAKLEKILAVTTKIGELQGNLILSKGGSTFLISAMEEA